MIVYVNDNYEIKDVGSTTDERLTKVEIVDDEYNPFRDWSVAKICCYKVMVSDGVVTMMTPYVDSRLIEHIDALGKGTEYNSKDITDTQEGLTETYERVGSNTTDIDTCLEAIAKIYEMVTGGK